MEKMSVEMELFDYKPGMEDVESDIWSRVEQWMNSYDYKQITDEQVKAVLAKGELDIEDFGVLLSPAAQNHLEAMAQKAMHATKRYFGNSVQLFTPLYISNYCENHCTYCGFNCKNKIRRGRLSKEQIDRELAAIAETGLQEVLILTGESRKMSDLDYIGEAIRLATKHFSTVGVEIYPLNAEEYAFIQRCGADFVSVYQETYDLEVYDRVHPSGNKRCFPYRFNSQERAFEGGMRGASFGVLLGLGDFRKDAFAVGVHAKLVQQKYPHGEINFSCPRLRPFINDEESDGQETANGLGVDERQLMQVMLAYRLFMPYAGITISTRERAMFRDHVIGVCATKVSAGVQVGVGGHDEQQQGDDQFEIADCRNISEMDQAIRSKGLQPVYSDYIRM